MGDKDLDNLLDGALSEYSSHDPRPGLEDRVLHRIRAAGTVRRFPPWAFAVPALAGLIVLVGIFWLDRAPVPRPPTITRAAIPSPVPAAAPVRPEPARRTVRRRHSKYPKRPQFPAPAPLTNQERALLALVKQAPQQAREILAEASPQSPEPIRIDRIEIPPLRSDGLN